MLAVLRTLDLAVYVTSVSLRTYVAGREFEKLVIIEAVEIVFE